MRFFIFNAMLLLQRVDAALRLERIKLRPDTTVVARLRRRKSRLAARLARPLGAMALAGG